MSLERSVTFQAAWDRRDPDPKKNYGVHGVEILFLVKGDKGATQFLLSTGWLLPETLGLNETNIGAMTPRYGHALADFGLAGVSPMPVDLGYHAREPQYEGQTQDGEICPYLGSPCYYDGSILNAERPFRALLEGGSEAVWDYLENYYRALFETES